MGTTTWRRLSRGREVVPPSALRRFVQLDRFQRRAANPDIRRSSSKAMHSLVLLWDTVNSPATNGSLNPIQLIEFSASDKSSSHSRATTVPSNLLVEAGVRISQNNPRIFANDSSQFAKSHNSCSHATVVGMTRKELWAATAIDEIRCSPVPISVEHSSLCPARSRVTVSVSLWLDGCSHRFRFLCAQQTDIVDGKPRPS